MGFSPRSSYPNCPWSGGELRLPNYVGTSYDSDNHWNMNDLLRSLLVVQFLMSELSHSLGNRWEATGLPEHVLQNFKLSWEKYSDGKTLRTEEKLQEVNSDEFRKLWHLELKTDKKQIFRKEKQVFGNDCKRKTATSKQAGASMCWGKSVKMSMGLTIYHLLDSRNTLGR